MQPQTISSTAWCRTISRASVDAEIAKIRKVQPYAEGKTKVSQHCLTTLVELSNADKHRTIQPVKFRADEYKNTVVETRDCIVRRIKDMRAKALDVDVEVARVYARKTGPDPDIALQGFAATSLSLDNGMWLGNFLQIIREFAPAVLGQFSEPDPEATDLLTSGGLLSPFFSPQPAP